jgi:hypothetical protein
MVCITHYSTINAGLIAIGKIFNIRDIYPFLICNTFGTVGTWYSALVLDPTIPARMMRKHGWTMPVFIIGDIGLHFVPLAWALYHIRQEHLSPMRELSKHCGLYSLLMNILWCLFLHRSFDPHRSYVQLPYQVWNHIWAVCVCFHLIPMLYMQKKS